MRSMHIIIQSTLKTLQKAQVLLDHLSDAEWCDASVPPYYSSIGTHIRHILDFYDCILNINTQNQVDLTARCRNKAVETHSVNAEHYLKQIVNRLKSMPLNANHLVVVIDDLGLGKTKIPYTCGALLAQANSHAIHHYAIINYIFNSLGIVIKDGEFGYNPTSPRDTQNK